MNNFREKIIDKLSLLKSAKLTKINHACDLIMLTFEKDKIEYAFHSQTLIRFIKDNIIFITRSDYFNKKDYKDESSISNFDVKLNQYKDSFYNKAVVDIDVNEIGDLIIYCEDNIKIEVIIDSSSDSFGEGFEHWRFFKVNDIKIPHFVINDNLEIDE